MVNFFIFSIFFFKKNKKQTNINLTGDPDQSIYTWRHACVANLNNKMNQEYEDKMQIFHLEMNYRSTANILRASQIVINQDSERIKRQLRTNNIQGNPIVLKKFQEGKDEAIFIAQEIKRLLSSLKPLLTFSDFAILMRTNSMSISIEEG